MRLDAECQAPEPRSAPIGVSVCEPTDRWWAARNRSGRRRCSGGCAVEACSTARSSIRPAAFPSPVCRRRLPAHREYDGRVSVGHAGTGRPTRRVADLRAPLWVAHRGMANVYPENTLEAYRGTVALGVEMVEPDCWLTRDGGLVCLHDARSTARPRVGKYGRTDHARRRPPACRCGQVVRRGMAEHASRADVCRGARGAGRAHGAVSGGQERRSRPGDRRPADQCGRLDGAIVQSFIQAELRPWLWPAGMRWC